MKSLQQTILESISDNKDISVIIKNIPYMLGFDEKNPDKEEKEIVDTIVKWIKSNNLITVDYITSEDVVENMPKRVAKLYNVSDEDYDKCKNEVKRGKELLSQGSGTSELTIKATNNVLEVKTYNDAIYIASTGFLLK